MALQISTVSGLAPTSPQLSATYILGYIFGDMLETPKHRHARHYYTTREEQTSSKRGQVSLNLGI